MLNPTATSTNTLASQLGADVRDRFLRYVRVDTQSVYDSATYPSSPKQLDLCRILAEELQTLGADEIELTKHGLVFATLPAVEASDAPTVGLIAHVDTSPAAPGANVNPQVWRGYAGGEISLPGDPRQPLGPEEDPQLLERVGHDIVTSDGTTLLGADDKAGVAEIMTVAAYLASRPDLPRPRVRIAFTVDEEIGHGTDHLDLDHFGADLAYTVDGQRVGEIENETFSAMELVVTFHGRVSHTAVAKGVLVNPIKLAADFLSLLPRDGLSPETTEARQGFVHPYRSYGTGEQATVHFLVRDFKPQLLDQHAALVERLAQETVADVGGASVTVERTLQYLNMREALAAHPRIVAAAEEAARRVGLVPRRCFIRGGTDGSRLTEKGLPTPNLSTGGNLYHSLHEWISVQDMALSAAALVELVRLWAEPDWLSAANEPTPCPHETRGACS